MRRLMTLILTLTLIGITPPAAANPPKAGASCKKLGQTENYKNLKFTCIKSGKKTVWNKGTPVNPKTKKEATVNPSPSPSGTPTPSKEVIPARFNEKCETKFATTSIEGQSAMCTPINKELIWQIDTFQKLVGAWQDSKKYSDEQVMPDTALDARFSPLVNRYIADAIFESLKSASRFWQKQFLPDKPLPVLFFTEKEKNWFKDQMVKMGLEPTCIDQQLVQFDEQISRTGDKANMAGYAGCNDVTFFDFYIGTARSEVGVNELKVGAHEYTHSGQFGALSYSGGDFAPCWFIEGGAEFYGLTLSAKNVSDIKVMRTNHVWDRYYLFKYSLLAIMPPDSIESFIEDRGAPYDHSVCGPDGAYPVGAIATEYLFLQKGQTGILKFMEDIRLNQDFKAAIQRVYGISWEDMKKRMADYIRLVIAQTPKPIS